ncbi:MAG: WecB/TagA/CpsF family glycosyltransferase [Synechococcales cyanobacterium]
MASRILLKTRVDVTRYGEAGQQVVDWVRAHTPAFVVAANVHVLMTAWWDPHFQQVLDQAALVTADGMPLVWLLRALGERHAERVYGPDLMLVLCERAATEGIPIYLYGSTPEVLQKLSVQLGKHYPGLIVAGTYAPPFRPLSAAEEAEDRERIRTSGARIIFVGLGCPKQELLMARWQGSLDVVWVGVGAAFNFHSGTVSQAPRWLMSLGGEWLYRLWQEPRLWRRYVLNNPLFVVLALAQVIRQQLGSHAH